MNETYYYAKKKRQIPLKDIKRFPFLKKSKYTWAPDMLYLDPTYFIVKTLAEPSSIFKASNEEIKLYNTYMKLNNL